MKFIIKSCRARHLPNRKHNNMKRYSDKTLTRWRNCLIKVVANFPRRNVKFNIMQEINDKNGDLPEMLIIMGQRKVNFK